MDSNLCPMKTITATEFLSRKNLWRVKKFFIFIVLRFFLSLRKFPSLLLIFYCLVGFVRFQIELNTFCANIVLFVEFIQSFSVYVLKLKTKI